MHGPSVQMSPTLNVNYKKTAHGNKNSGDGPDHSVLQTCLYHYLALLTQNKTLTFGFKIGTVDHKKQE